MLVKSNIIYMSGIRVDITIYITEQLNIPIFGKIIRTAQT